jgi:hypothetical protein
MTLNPFELHSIVEYIRNVGVDFDAADIDEDFVCCRSTVSPSQARPTLRYSVKSCSRSGCSANWAKSRSPSVVRTNGHRQVAWAGMDARGGVCRASTSGMPHLFWR